MHSALRNSWPLALLAALAAPSSLLGQAGPPPAPGEAAEFAYSAFQPPDVRGIAAQAADSSRRCAEFLASSPDAGAAQQRMLQVQRAVLAELASFADDADLEVRLRIQQALDDAVVEARVARMIASLPAEQRQQLVEFRRLHPTVFAEVLSQDWDRRVHAVRKITPQTDPRRLAEPLVILCLRHHSPDLVSEASAAVERCGYRSDAVVDALCHVLTRFRDEPLVSYGPRGTTASPLMGALSSLGSIGGTRAAQSILDALLGGRTVDFSVTPCLVDALVATREMRLVPTLFSKLTSTGHTSNSSSSWGLNNVTGTTVSGDIPMWAILRLTNQSPSEYGMIVADYREVQPYPGSPCYVGFAKEQDRKNAITKLKQWWADNQGKPPYRGLQPLDGSGKGESSSSPASAPAPSAASSLTSASAPSGSSGPSPASRSAAPALPEDRVTAPLAAATRRTVGGLRSPSYAVRQATHDRLLALYTSTVQPLADTVEDRESEAGKRLLDALSESITEASIFAAQAELSPEMRKKLAWFVADQPAVGRAAFSLNWPARVEAANKIFSQGDANAQAEALVLLFLRDSSPQIRQAALKLAGTGQYRSDEMIDALCDVLVNVSAQEWTNIAWGNGNQENPVYAALQAMTKIKSPRAAPVLAGLMLWRGTYNPMPAAPTVLADALVATGELGVMPALIERLSSTQIVNNYSTGKGKNLTIAPCDAPLLVLVKLTGQDVKDYGFYLSTEYGRQMIGFADEKARTAAVKKFNEWWKKAKDEPPYKDLKPISVPGISLPEQNGQSYQ